MRGIQHAENLKDCLLKYCGLKRVDLLWAPAVSGAHFF
jgi:hypothetical protein